MTMRRLPDAVNTVFSNVTRFDLDFSFDQFTADFPGFVWQPDLKWQIGAYAARVKRGGLLDRPLVADLEGSILSKWLAR